jgi:hypothetical protein
VIGNHPHRPFADLRRKFVRRLAHTGSTFSGVGASGKPGAVHLAFKRLVEYRLLAHTSHHPQGGEGRVSLEQELYAEGPPPQQDQFEVASEVRSVLRMLRPHRVRGFDKVRIGAEHDGGYICVEDFRGLDTAFSFGIDHNVTWDVDVANRGLKILQFDHTVEDPCPDDDRMVFHKKMISDTSGETSESLGNLIRKHDKGHDRPNIFLKIDIENFEWIVFDAIEPQLLSRIAQITGEFHAFECLSYPVWRRRAQRALKKITDHFALVHVHANNFAASSNIGNVMVPNVMELTFLNRSMYELEHTDEVFPGPLDNPCNPAVPDTFLGCFRF